jgi:hypothetical protein
VRLRSLVSAACSLTPTRSRYWYSSGDIGTGPLCHLGVDMM